MTSWTCPNTKCAFDKQLKQGQQCPLCERQAEGFDFSEFGDLLKEKRDFRKLTERNKKREATSARRAFCPKCGSANLNFSAFYRPSIWKCLDCGYEGPLIIEDSNLAEKIQESFRKKGSF
jgi:ribosomal protein L37AE/L43A